MDNNSMNSQDNKELSSLNDEIDIIELIRKIVRNYRFLLRITIIFLLLGIFVAIFSPVEYSSTTLMVPQTGEKNTNSNLGGWAAMAGINVGSNNPEILSADIYPVILNSIPFQKEVMQIGLNFEGYEEPVKLIDYFTDSKYQKFNMLSFIKKYTIGLPGVILGFFKKDKVKTYSKVEDINSFIQSISNNEKKCVDNLSRRINLEINDKKRYVELTVMMPEPLAAAQLTEKVYILLQKYITTFKVAKVQSNLEFVEERYAEAKSEFEKIQQERAIFIDGNKNISTAKATTEREKLDASYNLAFTIYSGLAKQLEEAKIQVKETMPILTIIDPPTIPIVRTKPRRIMMCIGFTFLGIVLGVGLIFMIPFYNQVFDKKVFSNSIKE